MDQQRRESLKQSLRSLFEQSLDERVERYLSVNHQWITGNHHFAHASSQCLELYRDGYFLSCIMVTQAVSEGIARFVADRNGITQGQRETKQEVVLRMLQHGIVTPDFSAAFDQIQRSFRNDFHHMNPPVARIDLEPLARRNVTDLATIEREIFECCLGRDGTLAPKNRAYWDGGSDGTIPVCLRLL